MPKGQWYKSDPEVEIYKVQRPLFSSDDKSTGAEAILVYNQSRSHIGQVTASIQTLRKIFDPGEFKVYVYAKPKQVGHQDGLGLEILKRAPVQEW